MLSAPTSWIAVAAILGVLSAGVLAGVLIGIALSIGGRLRLHPPRDAVARPRDLDTQVVRRLDEYPDSESYPGLLVLGFDAVSCPPS